MPVSAVRFAYVGIYCACLLFPGVCEESTEGGSLNQAAHDVRSSKMGSSATRSARRLQTAPPPSVPSTSDAAMLNDLLRPGTPSQQNSPVNANSAHGMQSLRLPQQILPSIRTPLTQLISSIVNPPAPAPAPAPAVAPNLLGAVGEQLNRTLSNALAGAGRGAASIVNTFRRGRPALSTSLQAGVGNATRQEANPPANIALSGRGISAPRLGGSVAGSRLPTLARVLGMAGTAAVHGESASRGVPDLDAQLPVPWDDPANVTSAGRSGAPAPSRTVTLGRLASDVAATLAEPFQSFSSSEAQLESSVPRAVMGLVRAPAQQPAPLRPMLSNLVGVAGALPGGVGSGVGTVLASSSLLTAAATRLAAGAVQAAVGGLGTAVSGLGSAVAGDAQSAVGVVASLPHPTARLAGGGAAAMAPLGGDVASAAGFPANGTGTGARVLAGTIVNAAGGAERAVSSPPRATAQLAGGAAVAVAPIGSEAASSLESAIQGMATGARGAALTAADAAEGAAGAMASLPSTAVRLAEDAAAVVAPLGNRTALAIEGALPEFSATPSVANAQPSPPASTAPGGGSVLPFSTAGPPTSHSPAHPSPDSPAFAGSDPTLPVPAGVSDSGPELGSAEGLAGTTGFPGGLVAGLGASGRSLAQSLLPGLAIGSIATGVALQNDVSVLINAAQKNGMQALLSQLFSDIESFAVGLNFTNFGGSTVASSITGAMQLFQELPELLSSGDSSIVGQVAQTILQSISSMCGGQTTELPTRVIVSNGWAVWAMCDKDQGSPSCSTSSFTLSMVPWSCLMDSSHNTLSCTPACLLLTKTADTCTILDLSGGTLAGMACGIQKRFGVSSSSVLGGEQFYLRVSDIVSGLEAAASSPAASPAAESAPSPAPSSDAFSTSWGKVASAFYKLIGG